MEVSFLLQMCQILGVIPEKWTIVLQAHFSALQLLLLAKKYEYGTFQHRVLIFKDFS